MKPKEAKEIMGFEIAPSILKIEQSKIVRGLFQCRVLDIANDHVLLGLFLCDENNPNKVLKRLGDPQWVKVQGKITLGGITVDLNFNGI